MRLLLSIWMLLWCSAAMAQMNLRSATLAGPVSTYRIPTPPNEGAMFMHLDASTLPQGPVTSWPDLAGGTGTWYPRYPTTYPPTNTPGGVQFNYFPQTLAGGSRYTMTNVGNTIFTNNVTNTAWFFAYRQQQDYSTFLYEANGSMWRVSADNRRRLTWERAANEFANTMSGTLPAGRIHDILIVHTNGNRAATWVNGVFYTNNAWFMATNGVKIQHLGGDSTGVSMQGELAEVIIWTNTPVWTDANAATLHAMVQAKFSEPQWTLVTNTRPVISGEQYRWASAGMPFGSVNRWVDEISGSLLQSTNTYDYYLFAEAQNTRGGVRLGSANQDPRLQFGDGVSFKPGTGSPNYGTNYTAFWAWSHNRTNATIEYLYTATGNSFYFAYNRLLAFNGSAAYPVSDYLSTNTTHTAMIVISNGWPISYINGTLFTNLVGAGTGARFSESPWVHVGESTAHSGGLHGQIAEIRIATNTSFTVTDAANWHAYATTQYTPCYNPYVR